MVRTVITPDNTHIELDIPADYIGRKVEINFVLLDEINNSTPKKTMGDFWGILSDKSANKMRDEINKNREEWERDI